MLAVFPKNEKTKVWVGISLNTASETVRWSEASVQRIAAMLVLWWYFYSSKKSQIGSFIKKLNAPRGNESYPRGKELLSAIGKGLKPVVVKSEEEPDEAEIIKRVDKRLRDLIALALNKAAPPDDGTEDEDDEEETAAVAEALTSGEAEAGADVSEPPPLP